MYNVSSTVAKVSGFTDELYCYNFTSGGLFKRVSRRRIGTEEAFAGIKASHCAINIRVPCVSLSIQNAREILYIMGFLGILPPHQTLQII